MPSQLTILVKSHLRGGLGF